MLVRDATEADAAGIASLSRENGAYYAHIAPDRFRVPDENGFVDFIRNDMDWRARPDTLSLVAEVDGEVAGYLEASLQPPLDSAPWQSQRDVGETRLLINFVGTADRHKRQGVATELVEPQRRGAEARERRCRSATRSSKALCRSRSGNKE